MGGAQTAFVVADGVTVAAVVTNTVTATAAAQGDFTVAKVVENPDGLTGVPSSFTG